MKKIKLTQGKFALVDNEDFNLLKKRKWHLTYYGYAATNINRKSTLMHHLIVGKPPLTLDTDHINRDKLDNQRHNLRFISRRDNMLNTGIRSTNKSGHKGVHWDKENKKWVASITKYGKYINLGRFTNIDGAVHARRQAEEDYSEKVKQYA